jgi:hypothetical protein
VLIPEWLYVLLLTSGITVIAVLLYLRRQWHLFMQVLRQIQQLNDSSERDLINFLDGLCGCLTQLSVCGLQWELHWFGQVITRQQGHESRYVHRFEIVESEARLQVKFYVTSARWEQAFYFELLRQQLRALCSLDLALKMRAVTSFEQGVARYQMFLAHDLKNLAQMVVLWQRQVQTTPASDAVNALQRWQVVAPLIADRAELLATRLTAPGDRVHREGNFEAIPLQALTMRLQRWAQVHTIKLTIENALPHSSVQGSWTALDDAAFQLMRNYQQHANSEQAVKLSFQVDASKILIRFCHPQSISDDVFRRMQEPLWTSSEQGFGLGLWQMGQVLQRIHGGLQIVRDDQGAVCFLWQLNITHDNDT